MAFEISEEPLTAARAETIRLLEATRSHAIDETRFDWLYQQNPDGPAILWAVRKSETGELAGFTVALPRRMLVDGRQHTCWNGADFSMDPRFRTLGPAIKLRRAAKSAIDTGRVDFLYSHPNERMAVIHGKVGHVQGGRMVRYSKILRTRSYIQERVGNPLVAGVAGTVLDSAMRLTDRQTRHRCQHVIEQSDSPVFDECFDALFEDAAPANGIIGVRDARYLNWRYAQNPLYKTHAVLACENDRLRGYALYTVEDDGAHLKDIFPQNDSRVTADLISGVVGECRRRGLKSVSFIALETNRLFSALARFGFQPRSDGYHMFVYAPEGSAIRDRVLAPDAWHLTVGDRDV